MSTPKTVAIIQSSYIPWKGYFDMIRRADVFVFLDDVQATRRDWRTRNRIKTANGEQWLSVPVHQDRQTRICDVHVSDPKWAAKHWRSIEQAYARAPFMAELRPWLAGLYEQAGELQHLTDVNRLFIEAWAQYLGIPTAYHASYDLLPLDELDALDPTTRLAVLCQRAGGTHYLSGPSAQAYMDVSIFNSRGLSVEWMRYDGYPEYPQLHGEFRHDVSLLDLLLMTGPAARTYLNQSADGLLASSST